MKFELNITNDCDYCGECIETCTGNALMIIDVDDHKKINFESDKCTNCEVCSDVCPVGAISVETIGE